MLLCCHCMARPPVSTHTWPRCLLQVSVGLSTISIIHGLHVQHVGQRGLILEQHDILDAELEENLCSLGGNCIRMGPGASARGHKVATLRRCSLLQCGCQSAVCLWRLPSLAVVGSVCPWKCYESNSVSADTNGSLIIE